MKSQFLVCLFCLASMAMSCHEQENKQAVQDLEKARKADDSLLNLARQFFKVLPPIAEDSSNPVTSAKVKLGKILFYDTRLSKNGNNSCNSCHNLAMSGADTEAMSIGDAGKPGGRNAPTVFNAALHNMQFWDGRARNVEEQAGMPILNPVEMAIPHKGFLINRLKSVGLYQQLFKTAFPGQVNPITYENLQRAIGAFERTLMTPSRFDKYMQGNADAISNEEKAGLGVFMSSGCANCHNGVGIGGAMMQKFGLMTDYRTLTSSAIDDEGRVKVTKNKGDKDVFKVGGLRNIAGTYPYFHDGSITTLDSAVIIMGKAQLNKNLSRDEVRKIVAFLNALTGEVNPDAKTFPPELAKKPAG